MKRFFPILLILVISLAGQDDVYPMEDFSGGGIGYSPIFIFLDYSGIAALDGLTNLGLDQTTFSAPFIVHGGEGFAHMTGNWLLGGYAGVGMSTISTMDTTGGVNKSLEATLSLMLGAATVEYSLPLFRSLEIATGVMLGVGQTTLMVNQSPGSPNWDEQFDVTYGTNLQVAHATSLSGLFVNFQPYLTLKWQILDRVGLRISTGFNKGTVTAGQWVLNGHEPVSNSPESVFQGVAIRTMLYFGI